MGGAGPSPIQKRPFSLGEQVRLWETMPWGLPWFKAAHGHSFKDGPFHPERKAAFLPVKAALPCKKRRPPAAVLGGLSSPPRRKEGLPLSLKAACKSGPPPAKAATSGRRFWGSLNVGPLSTFFQGDIVGQSDPLAAQFVGSG